MTRRELRELIKSAIKEYTGTGSSGGNAGDGNNVTSQRMGGGSFKTDEEEIEFYNNQNRGEGGQGAHTRGMEQNFGNYNSQKQVRF